MGSFLSLGNKALTRMVSDLSGVGSFFILVGFVFLWHSQFRVEYRCSCTNRAANLWYCWSVMILPAVLILLFVLGINKRFQRSANFTSRFCCRRNARSSCHFFWALAGLLNRACFAGLVWVVVLLMDGDWYLCCSYTLPPGQSHLPCKDKGQLSDQEKDLVFQMKNTSTGIGLMVLTSIILLELFLSALIHCCRSVCPTVCGTMDSYRDRFKDKLLEGAQEQIRSSLETAADQYVTARLSMDPKMKALLQRTSGEEADNSRPTGGDAAGGSVETETEEEVIARVRAVEWAAISDFTFQLIDDLPSGHVDAVRGSEYRRFTSVDVNTDVSGQEE